MEPKKKKAKTREKCQDCIRTEQDPWWGHTLCAYHRECSGNDDWHPERCTNCKKQKRILSEISVEDKKIYFRDMYTMLENTKRFKLETVNVEWEYLEILGIFLNKFEFSQFLSQNEDDNTNQSHGSNNRQVDERNETRAVTTEYDDPYNEEEDRDDDYYHKDNQDNQVSEQYDDWPQDDQNFNQVPNFKRAELKVVGNSENQRWGHP